MNRSKHFESDNFSCFKRHSRKRNHCTQDAFVPILDATDVTELREAVHTYIKQCLPKLEQVQVFLKNPITEQIEADGVILPSHGVIWDAFHQSKLHKCSVPPGPDPVLEILHLHPSNSYKVILLPVSARQNGSSLGIVVACTKLDGLFREEEKCLGILAKQVSMAYLAVQQTEVDMVSDNSHLESLIGLCGELHDQDAATLELKVIRYLREQTCSESGFLLLVVPETLELISQVVGNTILPEEKRFPGLWSCFAQALETKQPMFLEQIQQDRRSEVEDIVRIKVQSFLCVPVARKGSDNLIALACMVNKVNGQRFTELDIKIVEQCFKYTATVLTSTLAFQNERKLKNQTQALLHVAKQLFTRLGESAREYTEVKALSPFLFAVSRYVSSFRVKHAVNDDSIHVHSEDRKRKSIRKLPDIGADVESTTSLCLISGKVDEESSRRMIEKMKARYSISIFCMYDPISVEAVLCEESTETEDTGLTSCFMESGSRNESQECPVCFDQAPLLPLSDQHRNTESDICVRESQQNIKSIPSALSSKILTDVKEPETSVCKQASASMSPKVNTEVRQSQTLVHKCASASVPREFHTEVRQSQTPVCKRASASMSCEVNTEMRQSQAPVHSRAASVPCEINRDRRQAQTSVIKQVKVVAPYEKGLNRPQPVESSSVSGVIKPSFQGHIKRKSVRANCPRVLFSEVRNLPASNFVLPNGTISPYSKYLLKIAPCSATYSDGDFLYDLTKLLREIMQEARNLTDAERCSVFLLDQDSDELVATVFDGITTSNKEVQSEIRLPKTQGIAGHVATTGTLLNIKDAYSHPLFYRGIDDSTGFRTRNILCFPIKDEEGVVLGVAQLCNKKTGTYFTTFDEDIASAFAVYCCISISHSLMYKKVIDIQYRNSLANELMMFHMKCLIYKKLQETQHRHRLANELMMFHMQQIPQEEVVELAVQGLPEVQVFDKDFDKFSYPPRILSESKTAGACQAMFEDLGFITRWRLKSDTLARFLLMVKKGYRNPPYHNWTHAFTVTHFSYLCIKNLQLANYLDDIELFALFVSCLCHDIDHRGTTNSFQVKSQSVLAALYSSEGSVMERHHLAQSMCILNTEGSNIFENLNSKEYQQVLDLMRDIILATDVAHHLRIFDSLATMAQEGYDNNDPKCHELLLCLLMTASDLSDQTKNWDNTKHTAVLIYQEFFSQGDLEKALGESPLEMMDRERACVPDLQISFLDNIAIPVYRVLAEIFPAAKQVADCAVSNRAHWERKAKFLRSHKSSAQSLSVQEIIALGESNEEEVDDKMETNQQNGR